MFPIKHNSMRKEIIRSHIDKKILNRLLFDDPSEVRQYLLEVSSKFISRLPKDTIFTESEFDEKNIREKYLGHYVIWAQKRIIDLYRIESKDILGLNIDKKFSALLFKERLESELKSKI